MVGGQQRAVRHYGGAGKGRRDRRSELTHREMLPPLAQSFDSHQLQREAFRGAEQRLPSAELCHLKKIGGNGAATVVWGVFSTNVDRLL